MFFDIFKAVIASYDYRLFFDYCEAIIAPYHLPFYIQPPNVSIIFAYLYPLFLLLHSMTIK